MKKKKLIRIAIFIALFGLFTLLGVKNVAKADSKLDNYNYMYLVLAQEDSAVYRVRILYDYSTNHTYNDSIKYINLSSVDYENFSGTVIVGTIYLGYGYISSDNLILDSPYWCIPLNQYISTSSDLGYSTGYQVAQDYYQALLDEQLYLNQQLEDNYNEELAIIESNYQSQITSLNNTISSLQSSLASNKPSWGSFTNLLGTIFLFPIRFFREGFGIQLFGINVGHLLVGIGILGVVFGVVAIILHGRSKKE